MLINGKEYPIRFTLNTRRLFCREKGIDLPEFGQMFSGVSDMKLDDIENLALFILYGFREGARKQGATCDLALDDIVELFSEDPRTLEEILKIYAEGEVEKTEGKVMAQP